MKNDEKILTLLTQLQSTIGAEREQARNAIVKIGNPAVPFLVDLLAHPDEHLRWEACKALGGIGDASTAVPLVDALRDESMEVRWLAGEALISLGKGSVIALLTSLKKHFNSVYLREGAHHVLHSLERQNLLNKKTLAVLDALRYLAPRTSVAIAANDALKFLMNRQREH